MKTNLRGEVKWAYGFTRSDLVYRYYVAMLQINWKRTPNPEIVGIVTRRNPSYILNNQRKIYMFFIRTTDELDACNRHILAIRIDLSSVG